ncbi:hypothetical protein C0Q70_17476 [Pomacea canaliculata]|uniref:Fibronectin type-III domain-containing protein n=1 Tax=Pomacea canaliculata TaxID=400727 RepID=A0A2T7NKH6_POMCA|nr:hypothetical protein C0Q70_17476 [Pomacea canaliculata]
MAERMREDEFENKKLSQTLYHLVFFLLVQASPSYTATPGGQFLLHGGPGAVAPVEPTLDYGDYPVLEYRLYKMTSGREGQGSWEEVTRRQQREGVTEYTADVPLPSLSHPRAYKFRVDAFYDDYGKLSALASPGIETDFIVPCTGTDQFSANISTVPSQKERASQRAERSRVEVTWSVSDPSLLDSLYVTYSYQVIQVATALPCSRTRAKLRRELKGSRSRLMLHNLEPCTPITSTCGPPPHPYRKRRRSRRALSPPHQRTLTIFNISSTSASASWLKPSCPTRGGVLVYFELELREVDNSLSLPLAFYSSSQEVTFYNLQPATRYCLRVRYVNPAGQGPFSECANLTTTATSQMRGQDDFGPCRVT